MVSDAGQLSDVNEFYDEQGINLDDEEALSVEKGEFAQPPPIMRSRPIKQVKQVQAVAVAKRTASVASDADEGGKKKKTKKA